MLPPQTAWLPELEGGQDECMFLALRVGGRRLAGFMGLTDNSVSNVVKATQVARGEQCDKVVDEKLQESDPTSHTESAAVKKKMRATFVKNYPDKLPDVVGVVVDGTTLVTRFTVDMRKSVSVVVSTENIQALFTLRDKPFASASDEDTPTKETRDMSEFGYPEIKYNASRDVPCVYYNDADGRSRYHSEPVSDESDSLGGDDEKARMQKACDKLHAFYLANHHPVA
jgi:hypothetical protein